MVWSREFKYLTFVGIENLQGHKNWGQFKFWEWQLELNF